MKYIFFAVATILLIILSACSKDEAASNSSASSNSSANSDLKVDTETLVVSQAGMADETIDVKLNKDEVIAIYKKSCVACHISGVANAPKTHDVDAWAPRLAKGNKQLLDNIKNGYKGMPAKGLCMDCTDSQYLAITQFMASPEE